MAEQTLALTRPKAPEPRPARRAGQPSPVRLRLYGLVFLVVLALLLSLTVTVYQQVFTPAVRITLQADTLGNQLGRRSDVKLRGLLVGEVREVHADGRKATLDIALKPEHAPLIPSDVHARLLPKTIFGEKYVELVEPKDSTVRPIRAGDVITQDRTKAGIELQRLMDDLLPLLRTVQPGKLNATLSAFATALDGRGEEIGANLGRVESYLRRLNPKMPELQHAITRLADVTTVYDEAAPDLLRTLRSSVTLSRTLVEKEQDLGAFLTRTATASRSGEELLDGNADRLITLGRVSRPTLALLDRYAPEYPCLLAGLAEQNRRSQQAFRGGRMHITLEIVRSRSGYEPGEEPVYGERSGPGCYGLPDPPVPAGRHKLNDGARSRAGQESLLPGGAGPVSATEAEQDVLRPLVAPVMGVPADEVPPAATLLFGPLARGTEVSVA